MAKTIKGILNKKKLTGKEVGRALLLSLKNDIEFAGDENKKALFSQADYERMVNSLDTEKAYTEYKTLEAVYSSLIDSFNYNQATVQMFYNGFNKYLFSIREAQRAEDFYSTVEKFPLILSQGQYDSLYKAAEERLRGYGVSFYNLFFYTLMHFQFCMKNGEEIPETIEAAILETNGQPVTNKRILSNWAEDMGEFYQVLPDGSRSDEMTPDEWKAALKAEYMRTHKIKIDGKPANFEDTIRTFSTERTLAAYKLLFKGREAIADAYREKTGEEPTQEDVTQLEQELEEMIDEDNKTPVRNIWFAETVSECAKVVYYETPPADFDKYEALETMIDRYNGAYEDITEREQFKEFKKDYPGVYEAVKAYIEDKVPAFRGLKANQLYKERFTEGELADLDYLDYKRLTTPSENDVVEQFSDYGDPNEPETLFKVNKRRRGTFHGIAILQSNFYSWDRAENGDYKDPVESVESNIELLQGLDYLENNPDATEDIKDYLDSFALPALRYIYAYNDLVQVFADVYDVEFLTVAKQDVSYIESQIEALNNLIYMLYKSAYGTPEDIKRKRAFIKETFQPIDTEDVKPAPESVEALREKLTDLGYSREAIAEIKDYKKLIFSIMRKGYWGGYEY